MAYDIELKNQTGESIIYNEIGEISIPLADKSGEGTFAARHTVNYGLPEQIHRQGGDTCAFGVDFVAVVYTEGTVLIPDDAGIEVYIGGAMIALFEDSTATDSATIKRSTNQLIIKLPGNIITGDVLIRVEA